HFGNADAVPQPPERRLSRQSGIVRCCLNSMGKYTLPPGQPGLRIQAQNNIPYTIAKQTKEQYNKIEEGR
ncbi:MAG: hypothetical protein UC991_09570, partial [Gemmiger sp.]|uniref:hypothetical protein n=1 Tax=Gemmiger sp. TaxID=2049027 RepID=UPI002E775E7D